MLMLSLLTGLSFANENITVRQYLKPVDVQLTLLNGHLDFYPEDASGCAFDEDGDGECDRENINGNTFSECKRFGVSWQLHTDDATYAASNLALDVEGSAITADVALDFSVEGMGSLWWRDIFGSQCWDNESGCAEITCDDAHPTLGGDSVRYDHMYLTSFVLMGEHDGIQAEYSGDSVFTAWPRARAVDDHSWFFRVKDVEMDASALSLSVQSPLVLYLQGYLTLAEFTSIWASVEERIYNHILDEFEGDVVGSAGDLNAIYRTLTQVDIPSDYATTTPFDVEGGNSVIHVASNAFETPSISEPVEGEPFWDLETAVWFDGLSASSTSTSTGDSLDESSDYPFGMNIPDVVPNTLFASGYNVGAFDAENLTQVNGSCVSSLGSHSTFEISYEATEEPVVQLSDGDAEVVFAGLSTLSFGEQSYSWEGLVVLPVEPIIETIDSATVVSLVPLWDDAVYSALDTTGSASEFECALGTLLPPRLWSDSLPLARTGLDQHAGEVDEDADYSVKLLDATVDRGDWTADDGNLVVYFE